MGQMDLNIFMLTYFEREFCLTLSEHDNQGHIGVSKTSRKLQLFI